MADTDLKMRRFAEMGGQSPPYPLPERFPALRKAIRSTDPLAAAGAILDIIGETSHGALHFVNPRGSFPSSRDIGKVPYPLSIRPAGRTLRSLRVCFDCYVCAGARVRQGFRRRQEWEVASGCVALATCWTSSSKSERAKGRALPGRIWLASLGQIGGDGGIRTLGTGFTSTTV